MKSTLLEPLAAMGLVPLSKGWPVLPRVTLLLNLLIVSGLAISGLLIPGRVASGAGETAVSALSVVNPAARQLDLDRVGRWLELCDGAASIPLVESKLCTHGPDPAPAGYDVDKEALPLLDPVARDEMDRIFQASAAETSGARAVRFVHDASCQPIVRAVKVSPAGAGNFDASITELKNQGYNRADRIYLAFVDTASAGICGIGTIWNDDRARGSINWNNAGPSYARVDAGCWSGQVAAHEVMHNLGGVQLSAPNASAAFHCIDEYDVMCYRDVSGTATREA